jgi:hypothetical protein
VLLADSDLAVSQHDDLVAQDPKAAARDTFDLHHEDPPPYRTSLLALRHAYRLEAERLLSAALAGVGVSPWRRASSDYDERLRGARMRLHDRRFELTVDDVELARCAGGPRAVYELWTGESGAWLAPPEAQVVWGDQVFRQASSDYARHRIVLLPLPT